MDAKINTAKSANDHDNLEQACALSLALGASLPADIDSWPTGLVYEWNAAAHAGRFNGTKTIGDLARAFLEHRLAVNARVSEFNEKP